MAKTPTDSLRLNRGKLDARLAYLLDLPAPRLKALKKREDEQQQQLGQELRTLMTAAADGSDGRGRAGEMAALRKRMFAPLTAGFYLAQKPPACVAGVLKSCVSAFILFDGSADDLRELGVQVRAQAGDVFSAYVPCSAIKRLEKSAAVRFIELARPHAPDIDRALDFAGIDELHAAVPPIKGGGVVIGILDDWLDIYHPDFRTADGKTRVRFIWDQRLTPEGDESSPPTHPELPGFTPIGGISCGVEYDAEAINAELESSNPPATPAYLTVRHTVPPSGAVADHGTPVAGIAAGNGLGDPAGKMTGAAPEAGIIFVVLQKPAVETPVTDSTAVADGYAYVFARAAQLGLPCVVNRSGGDNQGPHDGTACGERFLDHLLLTPGRAIVISSGNSNDTDSHAAGTVAAGERLDLKLEYVVPPGETGVPRNNDDVEIWYDGHDRFAITVTIPTESTALGPVLPGTNANRMLANGVDVRVTSVLNDPRNNDNMISIIITVPRGASIPLGEWIFSLEGTAVINGRFHAWLDRNNRDFAAWTNFVQADALTLGAPATARHPIAVGNHQKTDPPTINVTSGCGPTRDGRTKPDIAATGTGVFAPRARDMNAKDPGALYQPEFGTSFSAPIVAGACALLFQCRSPDLSCADLKQILRSTAGTAGLGPLPNNSFGHGYLQMADACSAASPDVDVWLRDHDGDTGEEPSVGGVAWLSPDIEVLDWDGEPALNPISDPSRRFSNMVRVTVRNRGTQVAFDTEVFLYWAESGTNLPFPAAWRSTGIFTGQFDGFQEQGNKIVVRRLEPLGHAGDSVQVLFAWAAPAGAGKGQSNAQHSLLVRLENENDPSQIGAGGAVVIVAKNNIAMRNVYVQPDGCGHAEMRFFVEGTAELDSLVVNSELAGGRVELRLPSRALPWRDARFIEQAGERPGYMAAGLSDARDGLHIAVRDEQVEQRTDVIGAEWLALQNGIAVIVVRENERLFIPSLRIAPAARMPVSIRVTAPKVEKPRSHVHVTQRSGGRVVGGVSLELRPEAEFKSRK